MELQTYRDFDLKVPYCPQLPWREMKDTFEPFKDRPSHEKGLREFEDVFMIEYTRSLRVYLLVDPQQRSI